jgi:hypothetical protein
MALRLEFGGVVCHLTSRDPARSRIIEEKEASRHECRQRPVATAEL